MINVNLTEEEKRSQIEGLRDPNYPNIDFANTNMFVEAGAGAGKTTLIVKRIVNQLKNGDEPGSFVVITFTNAAAEELRGRIAAAVKEAGLVNTLAHLDEMNISTIHSFCNVLLKEQSILAGLPQNVELMEEDESRSLKLKYLHEYMSTLSFADWDALEKDEKEGETRRDIKQSLQELYLSIVDLPKDTQYIFPKKAGVVAPFLTNIGAVIQEIYDALFVAAKELLNPEAKKEKQVIYNSIEDFFADSKLPASKSKSLSDAYQNQTIDLDMALKTLLKNKYNFFDSRLTVAYLKDKVKEKNEAMNQLVEQKLGSLRDAAAKLDDSDITFREKLLESDKKEMHYRCIFEYAKKAKEYYYAYRPKNKMSNDNLLEFTRDLICNEADTTALEFFAKKYKHFYVDEFQDTDRIQVAFIYRLASDLSDPNHIKLRDGALFVVGDPKQSIYRFRGAQPKVYFDVKERMSDTIMTNAQVYELANNFRSNGDVITWINEKFALSDSIISITKDHSYIPMNCVKGVVTSPKDPQKLIHGIYHYTAGDATHLGKVVSKDSKTKEYTVKEGLVYNESTVEKDIQAVVDLILNLIGGGYTITRYDKDNNYAPYEDKIGFKDFLLICQEKKKMEQYLEVFKQFRIPVRFDGEAKLTADQVLNTYCRLYWYIVNPKEPFHRMGAKEAIRVSGLATNESDFENYADSLLDYLYDHSKRLSAFGKATYLETKMTALLQKDRDYSREDMMSLKARLRQMIEAVLHDATGTGVQLAEAFDTYVQAGVEHELSLESHPNAVRFMNVHKSKGLEGEIVILLDRRGHQRRGVYSMRDGINYYPGIYKGWSSISGLQTYSDKNNEEEDAEFHRLEYVAVTRAGQACIFMDVINNGGLFATSNNEVYAPTGLEKKGINYHLDELPNSVKSIIEANKNEVSALDHVRDYQLSQDTSTMDFEAKKDGKPLYETVNPSGLEKKHSAIKGRAVSKALYMLSKEIVDEESGRTRYDEEKERFYRPAGNILGNILHRTMELIIDRFDEQLEKIEQIRKVTDFCAKQAFHENKEDIPQSDSAEEYLEYVKKTAIAYYQWLLSSHILEGKDEAYTELPFSYAYTDEGDVGYTKWMHGTADLIIKYTDGRVCLIDYKSDNDFLADENAMEEGFREKYIPQINVYREIIQRMFNTSIEKITAGIVSFSLKDTEGNRLPGDEIRVRYTELK